MEQAIIDIGSNSIRLTVYEIQDASFKILFREKIMAGLASYVEKESLNAEGISCACNALHDFHTILQTLHINDVRVFATASLRNISNTEQAVAIIREQTGFYVEVLSGEDEALLGYLGVMQDLHLENGTFLDVGGASTEVVSFQAGKASAPTSFPIGSLSLYKRCVKSIMPGEGSLRRLQQTISETIDAREYHATPQSLMVGVGGTARATLKLAKHYFKCEKDCSSITADQLDELCDLLCSGTKEATNLVLKHEADRIHTIVPGMLILQHVFHLFKAQKLTVSKYGVREGYLCQKILKK